MIDTSLSLSPLQSLTPYQKDAGDETLLQLWKISKQFPGTLALDNVDFNVKRGEVHILFGENGAGKSTLIQVIAGVHRATSGTINLKGKPVIIHSVRHARELGVSAVFQEFSLVPQLTVEENLLLGAETTRGPFLNKENLAQQAREILAKLGFPLNPTKQVMYLSRAEQQMVEIAKAFRTKPGLMIFDEPTASLTDLEVDRLFKLIEQLKKEGLGIIYITHRMNEIKRVGDRITVLRDGRYVDTIKVKDASDQKLIELMTGRIIDQVFPNIKHQPNEKLLEIERLTTNKNEVSCVSINVCAGEVVGLAGLVGSGKSQIGRSCFGLEKITAGKIVFDGNVIFDKVAHIDDLSPTHMLDNGLYYLPSDRRAEGLIMMQSVRDNISISSLDLPQFSGPLFLRRFSEHSVVSSIAKKLALQPFNIERVVEHFSGGNQQKVLVGKSLARDVKLFIFDEPTVGVDVGARVAIYEFIRDLCEAGAGVLLISSDLPEILNLAHRTYVMHRGTCCAEIEQKNISEKAVLEHFFERKTKSYS